MIKTKHMIFDTEMLAQEIRKIIITKRFDCSVDRAKDNHIREQIADFIWNMIPHITLLIYRWPIQLIVQRMNARKTKVIKIVCNASSTI